MRSKYKRQLDRKRLAEQAITQKSSDTFTLIAEYLQQLVEISEDVDAMKEYLKQLVELQNPQK